MRTRFLVIAAAGAALMLAACTVPVQQTVTTPPVTDVVVTEPTATTASASFSVNPASGSYKVGSTFDVALVLDSGSEPVDAVDVVFRYPADLLSVVDSDTAKDGVQAATTAGVFENYPLNEALDGEVRIGAASLAQTPSGSNTVATVTFKVEKAGTAQVSFDYVPNSHSDTDVFSATTSTDIISNVTGGTYTLTE